MGAAFKTNPMALKDLLRECESGELQLPDFQRSWVWDDERIRSLLSSISQAFPVGAIMTLENGGEVDFKPRAIQGSPEAAEKRRPAYLLLDGQQRLTSLYQTVMRDEVVETVTARRQKVKRFYYIDIRKALDPEADREEAIIGVPEDKVIRTNFGKDIVLDVSTPAQEYERLMFPVSRVLDWDDWQDGLWEQCGNDKELMSVFKAFKKTVLQNFDDYQVPVIALDRNTSKEAVCLVFEKVNTGGKPLDAFELVTAMYAADGFELRKDWFAREARLKKDYKVLANLANTEFLQGISLLHTKERRREAEKSGVPAHDLPAISATRQSLLNLPLSAYKKWADGLEAGYASAAKFLHSLRIYRHGDLPYQSQITPLAAILTELGAKWDHEGAKQKVAQWYWGGVFGEQYGSATESRFARDMAEVPAWIDGDQLPSTVANTTVRADRLCSMRSRLSAAYKGLNALLMKHGAQDFRSGQDYDVARFFDEYVDIHHIFPRDWCIKQGIDAGVYDSIINKTPLSWRTNRILGGVAPSLYLGRLEEGSKDAPRIEASNLDGYLASHLIDPAKLRSDDFEGFFAARQEALLRLIESATGREAYRGEATDEPTADIDDAEEQQEAAAVGVGENRTDG
jgi:hypothetical protein